MIGFGENLGSGFPKILDAWKEAKWEAPTLEDRLSLEGVRLTLPIPFKENGTLNDADNALNGALNVTDGALNITDDDAHQLTEKQYKIYRLIKGDGVLNVAVNTKYLSETLGVSKKTIQRDLNILQEKGLIEWIGAKKNGYWKVIEIPQRNDTL